MFSNQSPPSREADTTSYTAAVLRPLALASVERTLRALETLRYPHRLPYQILDKTRDTMGLFGKQHACPDAIVKLTSTKYMGEDLLTLAQDLTKMAHSPT
jgi:hypothetical protein